MVPRPAATHAVDVDPRRGVVTKRFRSRGRREPEREWAALTLLAEYAPGLAPAPIRANLAADPPVIEMSRLPGQPLGGQPVSAGQAAALARALERLWHAAPAATVAASYGPALHSRAFTAQVRAMLAAGPDVGADRLARRAVQAAADWLASSHPAQPGAGEVILGHGDPNLANFLWDGAVIRIVDFEDAGPSCRAFELAILVEHRSAWSECGLDAAGFLTLFELTEAELAMLAEYRRLAAVFWLIKTRPESSANRRYRHDALTRQARRLLALLG